MGAAFPTVVGRGEVELHRAGRFDLRVAALALDQREDAVAAFPKALASLPRTLLSHFLGEFAALNERSGCASELKVECRAFRITLRSASRKAAVP